MTEKLKHLLHERAALPDFAVPDVDRLVRDGTRRARRRSLTLGTAGLAVATVAGALVLQSALGPGDADGPPDVATPSVRADVPTYARGSVIHVGDDTVEVGHEVRAFVRTTVGYVVADPTGTLWSVVGGSVSEVGVVQAEQPRLVSDVAGSLVGWVEFGGERPEFVVLDQASGEQTRSSEATDPAMGDLADTENPAYFYAIDGATAYWRDQRGAVAVDVASGGATVVDAAALNGFDLIDAEGDLIAFRSDDGDAVVIGPTRAEAEQRIETFGGAPGSFSPDGRFLTLDEDKPQVYDVASGEQVDFDVPRGFAVGYEWLDADTLVMISAAGEKDPVDLLTCAVPEGTCEVAVADLGTFADFGGELALPVGEYLGE